MAIVLQRGLLFLTLSMHVQAMEQADKTELHDAASMLVCSSGRHLRRNSWPKIADDLCTEAMYHNIHEKCANKGLQTRLRQAGLKAILIVAEDNQEDEPEE